MRIGVDGFVGARLTEARQARGITSRKALADMMQRAASTVVRWEEGTNTPEPAALAELAQTLSVPEDFFLSARRESPNLSFFRSFSKALRSERLVQEARLVWLEDIAAVADHYAHLPEVDVPDLLMGDSFRTLRSDDIEEYAQAARDHWSLGLKPISNMVELLERVGIIVAAEHMETDQLDGLSRWGSDGRPYVLLASDKQSFARRQFDAAHELAHLLLHRSVTSEEFSENFKLIEDQAHQFASSFLLPAKQFAVEAKQISLWELERLKSRWKVSIKAQIMRLRRLEMVDQEAYTRLFKIYSAKGYAKREPFDEAWPLQSPSILADVFRALVDAGQLTKAALCEDLPLLPNDVESLAGLPRGWLSQVPARVVAFKRLEQRREELPQGDAQLFDLSSRRDR